MTLPLFDDRQARTPRRVSLVRLAGEIARALGAVGRVAVEGEVYRPTVSRGGWIFFTLRDRAAQLDVKVPSGAARYCRAVQGERVCVVGALQWANDRGQVHLVAEEVTAVGAGAVAALIEETRQRLAAEGLLGRPPRPIPRLPAVIGVVCGSDAAVRKDIESVAAARFPGYPLHFEETTVSGPGAPVGIVDALHSVAARAGVEVVILARGGGDAPSLLPWSTEEVCRAVAACPVPVVSAIGHEGDRPLCDEVADLRCGTPSLAATAVIPELAALESSLDRLLDSAARGTRSLLERAQRRVDAVDTGRAVDSALERAGSRLGRTAQRLGDVHPAVRLQSCRQRLAGCDWRRPAGEILGRAAGRLAAEERHLRALSPQRTLERGYAVVTTPAGTVVRRARTLAPGGAVRVRLADGRFDARVTEVRDE